MAGRGLGMGQHMCLLCDLRPLQVTSLPAGQQQEAPEGGGGPGQSTGAVCGHLSMRFCIPSGGSGLSICWVSPDLCSIHQSIFFSTWNPLTSRCSH